MSAAMTDSCIPDALLNYRDTGVESSFTPFSRLSINPGLRIAETMGAQRKQSASVGIEPFVGPELIESFRLEPRAVRLRAVHD